MPYTLTWIDQRAELHFTGQVTAEEINATALDIYGHPNFMSCRLQIFDFSDADLSAVNTEDTQKYAMNDTYASNDNPNCRIAIVSAEDYVKELALHYRYLTAMLDIHWQIAIFDTLAAARQWRD